MLYRLATRWLLLLGLVAALITPGTALHAAEDAPAQTTDDEIIYIDGNGFIRVIDPNVATGSQPIQWSSPDGGWIDFATGDFNNDGDHEIVAIANNRLAVFDPVVRDPNITPDGLFNGVPWKLLYQQSLPGSPTLVAAGNMDAGVPGDEILVGFNVSEPNNINYRLQVLKTPDGGQNWLIHMDQGFGAPWKAVSVGNINGTGSQDVALIRENDSLISLREIDNNFNMIFDRRDALVFRPVDVVVGNFYPGNTGEVAYARTFSGTDTNPSLLIIQNRNNSWGIEKSPGVPDIYNYAVHPTHLFTADINGDGLDQLFVIRGVPSQASFARLFMVNPSGSNLPAFQSNLDGDGGYQVGAGGDVNGNGKDEIVIMRNDRIRLYYNVESGNTNNFTDYSNISTNGRSIALANLDGTGFVPGARLAVDQDNIELEGTAGLPSQGIIRLIRVSNVGSGGNIPFTVRKVGNANWFTMTFDNIAQTDRIGNIYLSEFNATNLAPGTYTERLEITSSNTTVVNQPFYIDVRFTVRAAPFSLSQRTLAMIQPAGQAITPTTNVAITGLPGLTFSAALLSKPAFDQAAETLGQTPNLARLTDQGGITFYNAEGESYTVEGLVEGEVSAAAVSWPSALSQIQVSSDRDSANATMTLRFIPTDSGDPEVFRGVLVVIADERAGAPPANIATAEVIAMQNALLTYLVTIAR
jgi:hypothetical protein